MNHKLKNLLALVLFIFSLSFLFAATSMQNNADVLLETGDCFHCHTASTCLYGGQAYGYFGCEYKPELQPPNNCSPYAYGCGGDVGEN